MKNDSGALSIDLLAGFTIFMVVFIWVISLLPGVLVNLQAHTIDYDAVAYRTGVILVEDPGEPWATKPVVPSFPWENPRTEKNRIVRFGLAISKDAPNIFSEEKIARFFDNSTFTNEWEYRDRTIFGDYPYYYNISLRNNSVRDGDNTIEQKSVGRILPNGSYGYSRRLVKIKSASAAVLDNTSLLSIQNRSYMNNYSLYVNNYTLIEPCNVNATTKGLNATRNVFSILIDPPLLYSRQPDPAYKIDLANEPLRVNISGLNETDIRSNQSAKINLTKIDFANFGGIDLSVDGKEVMNPAQVDTEVINYLNITIHPEYFQNMNPDQDTSAAYKPTLVSLTFDVRNGGNSTFLNNTWTSEQKGCITHPNATSPFLYDYNPDNVTQPQLRDAVMEIAISSGGQQRSWWGGTTNPPHTITSTAGDHGGISPLGATTVYDGDQPIFTITPVTGYVVDNVSVDGDWKGPKSSYKFSPVYEDHTIHAIFKTGGYTITANSGSHGTVEPAGVTSLDYRGSQTYTITADTGYTIADVIVDGSSLGLMNYGAVYTYPFTYVQADHTISATFKPGYTINATAGPHGAVEPAGNTTVYEGDSQTYTITPDIGYLIENVFVDESSKGAVPGVEFTNVHQDHTINATFKIATYDIMATSEPHGTVEPAGNTTLTYFDEQKYDITAESGYFIKKVYVDGISVATLPGTLYNYTFKNVTADHTINATFMSPAALESVVIEGIPAPGSTLRANVTPLEATATYQWQISAALAGPYSDISEATSITYIPGTADLGFYIRVNAAGYDAYFGTVTSPPVVVVKALTGVSIEGTPLPSYTLSANVTPLGATATYQWQRSDSPFGTHIQNISGAIDYPVVQGDIGYYLRVMATGTGAYTGTVASPWIPITTNLLGVSIAGIPEPGNTLSTVMVPAGATASCQWEVSRDSGISYIPIPGATLCTWLIPAPGKEYKGTYIVVIATGWGNYTGNVTSPHVKVGTYLTGITINNQPPKVGTPLTTSLSPAGATADYQWQRSLVLAGPYTGISGATSSTYTPVSGDLNYYLKVIATGTGDYGNTVYATTATVVGKGTLTSVSITGTPQVGSILTANVAPAAATATYQWRRSSTSGGTYTDIAGATAQTYIPDIGDVSYYLRVVATGTGDYTGTVTSTPVGPVTTPLTGVSISGTPQFNSQLTATVAPAGATAAYQWQRSSGGTYTNIAGATAQTYTMVCGDVGYNIRVVATGTGSYSGSVTSTPVGPVTAIPLTNVYITGVVQVGQTLTANVVPSGAAVTATYQWKRSLVFAGPYTNIGGATSQTYKLKNTDKTYYIEVVVTVPCGYSNTPFTSPPVGPVPS